jgi:hypothetical protein
VPEGKKTARKHTYVFTYRIHEDEVKLIISM